LDRVAALAGQIESPLSARNAELETRLADVESDREELALRLAEHEQQVGRLMNLYVATYQLHATLDPEEVRATIAEIAVNLLGAERFVLLFWKTDRTGGCEVGLSHGMDEDRSGLYAQGVYTGGDPAVDATLADGALRIAPLEGSEALACVPLNVQGSTVGALVILKLFAHKAMLQPEDRELLDLIAAHVASALFAARVYSNTNRKLKTMEGLVSEAVSLGRSRTEATSLSGNLEDVSVAEALQFIHLGGRTGTLTLSYDGAEAEIGLHQGRIVNAWGPGSKRLGQLLLDAGLIVQPTLDMALAVQEEESPRRSLGQILVSMEAVSPEAMYRAIEQQIEQTVYELVTWTHGTFRFASDDLKPIDDIAVSPGDVIRHLSLDTQMVLLDALRIFDERNRDTRRGAGTAAAGGDGSAPHAAPAATTAKAAPAASAPGPAASSAANIVAPLEPERVRLQVVSADKHLAEKLAKALPEARVAAVHLRDAGTPPPGEGPPIVVLDLRHGGMALDAISSVRRARPRAPILAVVDAGVSLSKVYQAGALSAVPGEPTLVAGALRSLAQNRRDLLTGGAAERGNATFSKLRRIVGDLRGGLISTTISLSLMNIISESVERAVFFLVRRDGLVALGAFGTTASGQPMAQLARGLSLPISDKNVLTDCLADGQARAIDFDEARFPEAFSGLVGRPRSGQCAIFPVLGGLRVIALVYADNGLSNRAIDEVDVLGLAAAQAGLAFENELLRRQAGQAQ
jgi:uncharacterized coiled-coil protein SlyX